MAALSKAAIEQLQCLRPKLIDNFRQRNALRERMEIIDRYIARESSLTADLIQGQLANQQGNKKPLADIELPLSFIQYQTALSYLMGIFGTGYPIFRMVATKEYEEYASMYSALMARDQSRFNWGQNIYKFLSQALKYNLSPMEISWDRKRAINVATTTEPNSPRTGATRSVIYEGNRIQALDAYNTVWDETCDPSEVHEYGQYAGYIQRMNYIRLKMFLHSLDATHVIKMSLDKVYKPELNPCPEAYYVPQIRRDGSGRKQDTNWNDFFGLNSFNRPESDGISGRFEVFTAYVRIIPSEYKMAVPSAGTPQVWKLIWANELLVYAEPIIAGHEYLPIIIGQGYDDLGMQTKSFVENVNPLQDLGTSIINGTIDAMRRAVADRGLYNPMRIKATDINSRSPTAKIPVKFTSYNQSFADAYMPLDYRDTVTPQFNANLNLVFSLADQTTGQNRAAQGNFVKGNKTLFEYQDVMANASQRLQLMGMTLENNSFQPAKIILRNNYLMYASSEQLFDPAQRKIAQIDPVRLRENVLEFRIADGLIPATKLANSEVLGAAIGLFGQNPDLAVEYDVGAMVISFVRQQGFDDVDRYKRTPEEQAAYIQRMAQLHGNAAPPEEGTDGQ